MILDHIHHAASYSRLNPGIRKALVYLSQTDFSELPVGRYPIKGDEIFALVSAYETRDYDPNRWENHQEYIDVQYLVNGQETIGFTEVNNCIPVTPYDGEKDIAFWMGEGDMLTLRPHMFAVFYPQDAHQPGLVAGTKSLVKKVVIKVRNYQTEE